MSTTETERPQVVLCFDLETTSGTVANARIVQIGAVLLIPEIGGDPFPIMSTLVNPGIPIPKEASDIHGILDEHVQYSPNAAWALTQLQLLVNLMRSSYVLTIAGHNCSTYDLEVIKRMYVSDFLGDLPVIDTFHMARRMFPDSDNHQLGTIYKLVVGKDPINAHDAVADCMMVGEIINQHLKSTRQTLVQFAGELAMPQAFRIMPFGKYKGRPVNEVPKSYMQFMLEKFDNMSLDLEYTVKKALGLLQ
jgi:DNA polymerase-3 subunit epsilon